MLLRRTGRLLFLSAASVALCPVALLGALLRSAEAEAAGLRLSVWAQKIWCRALLFGMRVRLDLKGEPPAGRYLVVSNHLSYVDIAVLGSLFPGRFVAKSEIAGWPVIGLLARVAGTLFVKQSKRRDVVRIGDEMERTLAIGVRVILFPEGGASRGVRIERLHSSLLEAPVRAGIPCLPVAIRYDTPGARWAPAGTVCWWGGIGLWTHLMGLLALDHVVARVRWEDEPRTGTERKELTQEIRNALNACFEPVRQDPLPPEHPGSRDTATEHAASATSDR